MWFYIFSTRFECGFTSFPLVSSVLLGKWSQVISLALSNVFTGQPETEEELKELAQMVAVPVGKTTLETSGEDVKLHSTRVGKM